MRNLNIHVRKVHAMGHSKGKRQWLQIASTYLCLFVQPHAVYTTLSNVRKIKRLVLGRCICTRLLYGIKAASW